MKQDIGSTNKINHRIIHQNEYGFQQEYGKIRRSEIYVTQSMLGISLLTRAESIGINYSNMDPSVKVTVSESISVAIRVVQHSPQRCTDQHICILKAGVE